MAAEAGLKPVKLAKSSSKSAKVGGTSEKDTRNKAKGISLPTLKEKTRAKGGKTKGPVSPAPASDDEAEAAVLDSDSDEEQDVHLHGFSTDDDEDSSDDEAMDAPALDVSQLPTVAKDDATVKAKLDRAKKEKVG
jgi:nucleolar protein 15